jgi:hypothetical protein
MNFENKILNIPKLNSLSENERQLIMGLFYKLTECFDGSKGTIMTGGMRFDYINGQLIYDTLIHFEYLIDKREFKINSILE